MEYERDLVVQHRFLDWIEWVFLATKCSSALNFRNAWCKDEELEVECDVEIFIQHPPAQALKVDADTGQGSGVRGIDHVFGNLIRTFAERFINEL